jgi:hypothetical protein
MHLQESDLKIFFDPVNRNACINIIHTSEMPSLAFAITKFGTWPAF